MAVIACLAAVAACSSNQSTNNAGGNSPPANAAPGGPEAPEISQNSEVLDPEGLLNQISTNNHMQTVKFDPNPSGPANLVSHVQGYARYHGGNYDFHIFSYSNVSGSVGYLYFASNNPNGKSQRVFTVRVPETPLTLKDVRPVNRGTRRNPNFNHPGGIQVIGDYLVVPVIPFSGADSFDAAIIYLYDLRPLKGPNPQAPYRTKEIMRLPKTNGAACVGITRLQDGRFALGVVAAGKKTLDIYTTSDAPQYLWDATWNARPEQTYNLKSSYQNVAFLLSTTGNVYMIGFEDPNYVNLYQLTRFRNWVPGGTLIPIGGVGKALRTSGRRLRTNASFRNGAGIEIYGEDGLYLYATEKWYGPGGSGGGITINSWGAFR